MNLEVSQTKAREKNLLPGKNLPAWHIEKEVPDGPLCKILSKWSSKIVEPISVSGPEARGRREFRKFFA